MSISYDKLWKLLIDNKMNKTELRLSTGISSSTLAKLTKREPVTLEVLEKICDELDCNIVMLLNLLKNKHITYCYYGLRTGRRKNGT